MTSTRPVVSNTTPSGAQPILTKDGRMSWPWMKFFQNIGALVNVAFDAQAALQGVIGLNATVAGRPTEPLVDLVQKLTPGGGIEPGGLPTPTNTTLGGVLAAGPTVHNFITQVDETGLPHLGQPAFTDVSGIAAASQVPALSALNGSVTAAQVPNLSALNGSVTSGQVPALSLLTGQITEAQLPSAGLSVTITSAKLTSGGTEGSMQFQNGILIAQTPAT